MLNLTAFSALISIVVCPLMAFVQAFDHRAKEVHRWTYCILIIGGLVIGFAVAYSVFYIEDLGNGIEAPGAKVGRLRRVVFATYPLSAPFLAFAGCALASLLGSYLVG